MTDSFSNTADTSSPNLGKSLIISVLHRMDAWGVAMISGGLALWLNDAVNAQSLTLVGTLGLAYGIGYAVNDYYDAPDDALDENGAHRNFFVSHPQTKSITLIVLLVSLCLMFAGFASFGVSGIAAFGVSIFIVFAYSAPPLRFKSRPGMDLLVHACFVQTYPYLVCVFLSGAIWSSTDSYMAAINFLASLSGQIAQQIRDRDVDMRTGRTFVTEVGLGPSSMLLKAVSLTLGVVAVWGFLSGQLPLLLLPLTVLFMPAFMARVNGSGGRSRRVQTTMTATAMIYIVWLFVAM